jgi:hypothetical protein
MDMRSAFGREAFPRMGEDVQRLVAAAQGRSLAVGHVVTLLDDRGWALAVLLLTVPFVLPLPTMGMALPVGLLLALTAVGVALGRPPALPGILSRRRIAYPALTALSRAVDKIARRGPLARPRLRVMTTGPLLSALGASLFCAALVLALPLPLPMSNFFPAVAILLLAAGMLEGDGLLVLAGHGATLAVCAVVAASGTTVLAVGSRIAGAVCK